jgi:hypothetical protein
MTKMQLYFNAQPFNGDAYRHRISRPIGILPVRADSL